jgi:truncated hemoglobin YjbI
MSESERTLFDELGGEPALRAIVNEFVDRIFDDAMIGFFFRNADRKRVKEKEYEFAARHLGAAVPYTGKPLPDAHAPHRIMGGQFNRRLQVLKETLDEFHAPARVREHWIRHTELLRPLITGDAGTACDPTLAARSLPKEKAG